MLIVTTNRILFVPSRRGVKRSPTLNSTIKVEAGREAMEKIRHDQDATQVLLRAEAQP